MVEDLTWNIAPTLGILKPGLSIPLVCLHMQREGDTVKRCISPAIMKNS